MAVEFRLLGPVEVSIDGRRLDVGHARQQCVLAALLVDAGMLVTADQLLDRVWGAQPPQRARGSLHSYLSRLRKVLAPAAEVSIDRRSEGYVLDVPPGAVDITVFRDLVRAAAASDDHHAASLLDQALALWRGDSFGSLDTPWLDAARQALDAERLSAQLDRNDVVLRLGRHSELVGTLFIQATAHPWDERVAGQLILALYRCGRQAEALTAYQGLRERLADELGTDPSPPLRRLHEQILRADPGLAAPVVTNLPAPPAPVPGPRPARPVPVPRQLPAAPRSFVGRTAELAQLDTALEERAHDVPLVAVVTGGGGMGKTWLALRWATARADHHPDGQLYVDLHGFDPVNEPLDPSTALRTLLEALGVDPLQVPTGVAAQSSLYRSLLADRAMLVLLDNARDADAVLPMIPGAGGSTVLATSRRRLTSLAVTSGARILPLDVMPDDDARDLLQHRIGRDLTSDDRIAVARLVAHCDGLPLALAIVGAQSALQPDLPLHILASRLQEQSARLDALDGGELAIDLRAVLGSSRQALTANGRRVFDLLGLVSGPDIGVIGAASLAALSLPSARVVLAELVAASLVQEHQHGRYHMHDLVRLYAAECAGDDPEAMHRLLDHYLHTAHAAALLLSPHREPLQLSGPADGVLVPDLADLDAALGWFSVEHRVLLAATGQAAGHGFDTHAHQLAWTMATYLDRRGPWTDWATLQHVAIGAAGRSGDITALAQAHRLLANAYSNGRRYDDAADHLHQALDAFARSDDIAGQAHVHFDLALLFDRRGRPADACRHAESSLTFYRAVPHPLGEAVALNALGWYHCQLGDYRAGIESCELALRRAGEIDSAYGRSNALDSLGYAHHQLGEYPQAIAYYQEAVELLRDMGDRHNGAVALDHLGDAYRESGQTSRARAAWREALDAFDALDHPDADPVRAKLGEAG